MPSRISQSRSWYLSEPVVIACLAVASAGAQTAKKESGALAVEPPRHDQISRVNAERASATIRGILGKEFDSATNVSLVRLINATQFPSFGWLWQTQEDYMDRSGEFGQRAAKIAAKVSHESIAVLGSLSVEDAARIGESIAAPTELPRGYETWAGESANGKLHEAASFILLKRAGIVERLCALDKLPVGGRKPTAVDWLILRISERDPASIPATMIPKIFDGVMERKKISQYLMYEQYIRSGQHTQDPLVESLTRLGPRMAAYAAEVLREGDDERKSLACSLLDTIQAHHAVKDFGPDVFNALLDNWRSQSFMGNLERLIRGSNANGMKFVRDTLASDIEEEKKVAVLRVLQSSTPLNPKSDATTIKLVIGQLGNTAPVLNALYVTSQDDPKQLRRIMTGGELAAEVLRESGRDVLPLLEQSLHDNHPESEKISAVVKVINTVK